VGKSNNTISKERVKCSKRNRGKGGPKNNGGEKGINRLGKGLLPWDDETMLWGSGDKLGEKRGIPKIGLSCP